MSGQLDMKHKIEVRLKSGFVIATIKRKLRSEQIGNFNPIFCTYKHKQYLVKSEEGDLSDPFRRDENYLNKLYIEFSPEQHINQNQ
jgi:hypothetical protein